MKDVRLRQALLARRARVSPDNSSAIFLLSWRAAAALSRRRSCRAARRAGGCWQPSARSRDQRCSKRADANPVPVPGSPGLAPIFRLGAGLRGLDRCRPRVHHELQRRSRPCVPERHGPPHQHRHQRGPRSPVHRRRHAVHAGRLSRRRRQAPPGHVRVRLNRRLRPQFGVCADRRHEPRHQPVPARGCSGPSRFRRPACRRIQVPATQSTRSRTRNPGFRDFNTALSGAPGEPAIVSFEVRWQGWSSVCASDDPDTDFSAAVRARTGADGWSAVVGDYPFQSAPIDTSSSDLAEVGTMRNGVFSPRN